MLILLIETFLCLILTTATPIEDYYSDRTKLVQLEADNSLGGNITLNGEEIKVNEILMRLKSIEDNSTLYHPNNFDFKKHYFEYKDYINKSLVHQMIKMMPKGAALHTHETYLMDADYLVNLTYEDNLYVCHEGDDLKFYFAERTPERDCRGDWKLMSELRANCNDIPAFDCHLKTHFTIVNNNDKYSKDTYEIWKRFDQTRRPTKSLISYRPVREKFLYEALQRFYDDNVMYIEMRTGMFELYELNGTKHDTDYTITMHRDITNKFIEDHPDFIGMKLIISTGRFSSQEAIKKKLHKAIELSKNHPDMIAGFDLVGHEEKGHPLTEFIPLLVESKGDIDYYFHAGETNWFGTPTDENLIDAILLSSKRIGHAYSLDKHPLLLDIIKAKDIAVEVNVISNAVLDLVSDIRAHPLASFLSRNVPVVLSSDDPGVWGAEPLSHDFYVSFMAVANRRSDLKVLKQLALNSITYSALDFNGKNKLREVFDKRWNEFLEDVLWEATPSLNIDIDTEPSS